MILVKMVVKIVVNRHAFAFAFAFDFLVFLSRFMLNNQLDLWFRDKKIKFIC
jgi:hypothetical protein